MRSHLNFYRNVFVITTLLFLASSVSAMTVTWVGGNGHWHQPNKWDTGQIPTANDDVIIPSGFARVEFANATARSVTVESGAIFLVNTNGELIFENQTNVTVFTNHGLAGNYGLIHFENIVNSSPSLPIFYNYGAYHVLQGGKLDFQNNTGTNIDCYFNATFNNYGSIICEVATASGNQGILNSGDFENRQTGFIYIEGSYWGILNNTGQYTRFRNRGKIIVSGADAIGIKDIAVNTSVIRFRNYNTGSITLKDCNFTLGNTWNDGVITVSDYFRPYPLYALNGGENTINEGIINLFNNQRGLFLNQYANFTNEGTISIYDSADRSIYFDTASQFFNSEEGYIYMERDMVGGAFDNNGIIISKSVNSHSTVITNNGIIEDYNGMLPTTTINNKVIIRPIQGPLINGSPTSNFLDKTSLSGITIGDWRDAIFGGNVSGTYNGGSNIFTPNFHGHGEGDLYANMEISGTNNSALVNIKIINAWNNVSQESDFAEVGFEETDKKDVSLNSYPNPTSGVVTFNWDIDVKSVLELKIFNAIGAEVWTRTLTANDKVLKVDLSELGSSGIYFYQLTSESEVLAKGKTILVK